MITRSANYPVRALWRSFGATPWISQQAQIFGFDETNVVEHLDGDMGPDHDFGRGPRKPHQAGTTRGVGSPRKRYRDEAWRLMTSVVPSQTWGITKGVPAGWTVAQEKGFAGNIANSVGFVRTPDSEDGYVVVVLTNGWSDWSRGVPVVEEIAGWVSANLARPEYPAG